MPYDVPIVIRVLSLLSELPTSFRTLQDSLAEVADAPKADRLFEILDTMRREGVVAWNKPDSAGGFVRAKLTEGQEDHVRHEITEAGRAKLAEWKSVEATIGSSWKPTTARRSASSPGVILVEFAEHLAGVEPKPGWMTTWLWDRRAQPVDDLRSKYASFWESEQIEARKQAVARKWADEAARRQERVRNISESRWRWVFWKRDGSDRLLGQIGLMALISVVVGLTWAWLFGKK